MADALMEQIAENVRLLRQELAELKEEVNDLRDIELEVRPEYLGRLERIQSEPFKRFSSVEDLRKEIERD